MKVTSPAGDFEITVVESSVENDCIVISGQMGVWDSKIHMKPADLLEFAKVLLNFKVILFLAKQPFRRIFRAKSKD